MRWVGEDGQLSFVSCQLWKRWNSGRRERCNNRDRFHWASALGLAPFGRLLCRCFDGGTTVRFVLAELFEDRAVLGLSFLRSDFEQCFALLDGPGKVTRLGQGDCQYQADGTGAGMTDFLGERIIDHISLTVTLASGLCVHSNPRHPHKNKARG